MIVMMKEDAGGDDDDAVREQLNYVCDFSCCSGFRVT